MGANGSNEPWDIKVHGEEAILTYGATSLRMPKEQANRFGLAVATACTSASKSLGQKPTVEPEGRGKTTARKPAAKR